MRGTVFHYDENHDYGYINGVDGKRYIFGRKDLTEGMPLAKGLLVQFTPDDGTAHDIVAASRPSLPANGNPEQRGRNAQRHSTGPMGLWAYFLRALGDDYRNFTGRARRKEFWAFYLWFYVVLVTLFGFGILLNLAISGFDDGPRTSIGYIPALLFVLAAILPSIAVVVRRLHDIGLTGWFALLCYIPAFGAVAFLIFGLLPSQFGENRWGSIQAGVRF
ncbi:MULTISPECIES: DUF805 domain-containing protein [unclassified Mesorhizobium]|uniref:DUF805 domain-containing protein n=1 Tax=unclassified Mesorhizobium TaxID=325217 RepID=UPI000FCCDACE|nr:MULTISPECIES: DUF805 domain-containing protein [unclassified Mesorhizobium]RUX29640.1 DUF805 domain-containing protein [Mesorhizobium sp. M2A.F.Ca.ET.042.01.1.1]RWD64655.1 MAG: DUF805 domain-containing protein [Mesorhizobium sp.]TIV52306.1 MAG: DUF805 domain-containing protein [Mesorhizobium sp.]